MTTSFWHDGDPGAPHSCEIAVVGGGIIGTSTAYWLKKLNPDCNVVLLESHTIGHGASGRNAGFLLQGTASNYATDIRTFGEERARALWAFTDENRSLISEHFDANKINLRPSGSLIAAGSQQEQDALERSAELLRRDGIDVELWDNEKLEASLRCKDLKGGLFVPAGASMNPMKLLQQIGGLSGARILEHHPVIDVEHDGTDCILHTPLRQLRAARVFFALNAYLPHVLPYTSEYVRPVRAQMLASSPQPSWLPFPVYSHEGYYYIRQAPDGSVLLGGARHLFRNEEIGFDDLTTPHLQRALETYYQAHFPGRPLLAVTKRWSGTMGFTSDGLPMYAEARGFPGSYWAAGFNGHGMGYGFRFGQLMAHVLNDPLSDKYYRNLFHTRRME